MKRVEIPVMWVILLVLAIMNTLFLSKSMFRKEIVFAQASSRLDKVGKINENDFIEFYAATEILDDIVEEAGKTIPISEVKISRDMDLTERTGLSRDDFIKLMTDFRFDSSGFFEENAGTIYDLCAKYSINELFFCGLIGVESGWNIAGNHRRTHNYISLMSGGRLISYGSVYEGLEVAAQKLHNNYLQSGGKFYHGATIAGVKVCFCPASSTWSDKVYSGMKQILR